MLPLHQQMTAFDALWILFCAVASAMAWYGFKPAFADQPLPVRGRWWTVQILLLLIIAACVPRAAVWL